MAAAHMAPQGAVKFTKVKGGSETARYQLWPTVTITGLQNS